MSQQIRRAGQPGKCFFVGDQHLPNPTPKLKKVLIKDVIAKLHKTHPGVIRDKEKASTIPLDSQCRRCGGTGNELFAMYKRCQACGGDGITRHNESEFSDA